jgi:hypothetical protein
VNTSRFRHVVLFNDRTSGKIVHPATHRRLFCSGAGYAGGVCALDRKLAEGNLQDPEAAGWLISLQLVYAGTTSDRKSKEYLK